MSNYTKSTNFAAKDSLLHGNPAKIVKGTEIDTEFNNIATAVATKADLSSPTFTGTPAAPTASSGTSSTQLATTAFVQAAGAVLTNDYTTRINNEVTARNNAINVAIAPLATIAGPTFTGTVSAPTPSSGDSTTKVATTAFIQSAISAQKFNYTVSSSPPSGGNDGDFWFQVG